MEDFKGGEKCKDFSKNSFIVMGNRPKWKILKVARNGRISQKMVSL
jgi:phage gpG-like protein